MSIDMKALARRGAEARIAELTEELQALRRYIGGRQPRTVAADTPEPVQRRRKPMSAAQKKAVGLRMKKYWAERRKAEGKA